MAALSYFWTIGLAKRGMRKKTFPEQCSQWEKGGEKEEEEREGEDNGLFIPPMHTLAT